MTYPTGDKRETRLLLLLYNVFICMYSYSPCNRKCLISPAPRYTFPRGDELRSDNQIHHCCTRATPRRARSYLHSPRANRGSPGTYYEKTRVPGTRIRCIRRGTPRDPVKTGTLQNPFLICWSYRLQGSPSGGRRMPPGGDASRKALRLNQKK